jgi:hypothetical protein
MTRGPLGLVHSIDADGTLRVGIGVLSFKNASLVPAATACG